MNRVYVILLIAACLFLGICLGMAIIIIRRIFAGTFLSDARRWLERIVLLPWTYRWRCLLALAGSFIAMRGCGYAYDRYEYPYGWSHCCDRCLGISLVEWAAAHDGWFPRGEATPEASLSLLYTQQHELADILRGKTVPKSVVLARLENGQLLTPETCGWHYVEGLRSDDDPQLALFWDKAGLGHNGQRLPQGGHWVGRVLGTVDYVPEPQWTWFLEEQTRLREAIRRSPG